MIERGPDVITFSFRTKAGIADLHFRIDGGAHVHLALEVDGHPIASGRTFVGHHNAQPAAFTVLRRRGRAHLPPGPTQHATRNTQHVLPYPLEYAA